MKILFITNHLEGNDGYSKYSCDLISHAQNQGNEVLCVTSKKTLQENEFNEICVLKDSLEYFNPVNSFLASLKISKIIKNFSPDIIHFLVEPYASVLPFLNTKKIKTFITIHGTYSYPPILLNNAFKKIISRYLTSKMYKRMDGIIAVSNFTKNHLLNYLPELAPKIKVITNGVDLNKYAYCADNRQNDGIKRILFLGAVKYRKGILEAVRALNYYNNYFSTNFIYDIAGFYEEKDPYYKKIKDEIINFGLEDKIALRGRVSDEEAQKFYNRADLFLMPAINNGKSFEGFGLVYLEANAKGIPCIGTKGCGASEAIIDGKTGYIVDVKNYKETAEKINLILEKNAIKKEDCIEWAKENSIEKKAKEIFKFYQSK